MRAKPQKWFTKLTRERERAKSSTTKKREEKVNRQKSKFLDIEAKGIQ